MSLLAVKGVGSGAQRIVAGGVADGAGGVVAGGARSRPCAVVERLAHGMKRLRPIVGGDG